MSLAAQATASRQHARYPVDLTVDYATRDAFLASHVSNLGRGGLFIECAHPLRIDSELEMTFILPGSDERITARGRVVWSDDLRKGTARLVSGMGVRFVDISRADRRRLSDCLAALPPLPV